MGNATSADDTVIEFDKVGFGPPLVLVTDLPGHDFTAYHYDRRGRGGSTDTRPYAVGRELEDLAAPIADAGGEAHLLGRSAGTVLALDAAARASWSSTAARARRRSATRPRPKPCPTRGAARCPTRSKPSRRTP
ncbi:alpha/beta hydrolase [Amycolatopsis sp. NPDC005961]|uniref:alpha/beta fold hydrolase n=1 Tax=Amycolatopsis sp. NPDC005961 TaxID=3156720 RepID=UPI0033EC34F3